MLIVPVIEGRGDALALPRLLERILHERLGRYDIRIARGKQNVVNAKDKGQLTAHLGRYLLHAARKPRCDGILVLVDTDEHCCPINLANHLRAQIATSGTGKPVEIVCACQEYEAWFLASIDTIKGNLYISNSSTLVVPAEGQRSPKGWLSAQMPRGRSYKPTSHQLPLTELVDLDLAHQNSRSFRRLCHAVEQLSAHA